MEAILFFILAFISVILGTIAGFGSSTILLPLSLFFLDFRIALVLVALVHLFGNIGKVIFFRKSIDKRLILLFAIPGVILTLISANLIVYLPKEILILVLGVFLLIFS